MNESIYTSFPDKLKAYFDSGATRSYAFRIGQLKALHSGIKANEKTILKALHTDLRKSAEEAFATEVGLVLKELSTAINGLKEWMRPKRVPTDLLNLPSRSIIYKDPLGVVLIIGAWNYPFQLIMSPLIGAIAGGNCAVLKPSEVATATSALISDLITNIFSDEYVKVIEGEGSHVIPAMMKSFTFDHVFYTGSVATGKLIYKMAAERLVPVTLELGGKSPAVVDSTADLQVAARRIVLGKFLNAGQTCIAPDYVLVHNDAREKLIAELKRCITSFYTEKPETSREYGRIMNAKRFETLISYLMQGEIISGGRYNRNDLFIEPTIIENIQQDAAVMHEEIFGPILPVIGYNSTEEAMRIVEKNKNPLALYLFTTNATEEKMWMEKVAFGGGCINNADWHFANHHLPFGGIGNSGIGAYHGKHSFDLFTHAKSVLKTPNWFDPRIKYPPFRGKLKFFKKIFR